MRRDGVSGAPVTLWTAADAAAATGGQVGGDWAATGVSIDTRTLQPGDMFVALKAARDGHSFVAQALEKGAVSAMVDHVPSGVDPARCLVVGDVLAGLTALGAAGRARTGARVIAITGSVGKTTAKEMTRKALENQGKTHAAVASYNNHWGVPLTLARMPADTDYAVIEIGMNAPGEIAPLSRLARPHVAMITTIGEAHLEAFGRIEGIAEEKGAIFQGLEPGGLAVLPGDLPTTPILRKAAAGAERVISFGENPANDWQIADIRLGPDSTVLSLSVAGDRRLVKLAAPGRHFAQNATLALIATEAVGADAARAALALAAWQPVEGRGVRERLAWGRGRDDSIEIIDDSFNANPTSLAAGLEVLAAATPGPGGRRVAVLGDMLELGPDEVALHRALAGHASMAALDRVHTAGRLMAHLHAALPVEKQGLCAPEASALMPDLGRDLGPGDVVLVKGSKGSRVSAVVDALRKLGQSVED